MEFVSILNILSTHVYEWQYCRYKFEVYTFDSNTNKLYLNYTSTINLINKETSYVCIFRPIVRPSSGR
jgi:hypothetical protein